MSFDRDSTRTDGKSVRQSENHLNEIGVNYRSHIFCGYFVVLVISIN